MAKKSKPPKRARIATPEGGWQAVRKTVPSVEAPSRNKRVPDFDSDMRDFNQRQLVWRFSEVDFQWEHLENSLDNRTILAILDKLRSFETMRLGELFRPGMQHAKRYDLPTLPAHALARLQEISRDDEDEIVRLRLSGKGRLYGIMREHVFHMLWWDPKHKVWPSKLKNT